MSRAKPVPAGMHSLTPHLICEGAAAAIDFYKAAFGAVEEHPAKATINISPSGDLIEAAIVRYSFSDPNTLAANRTFARTQLAVGAKPAGSAVH